MERQEALDRTGRKVNAKKTKVMVCPREAAVETYISDKKKRRLKKLKHNTFKYPGSTISENDGCEEEVRHRVGAAWR